MPRRKREESPTGPSSPPRESAVVRAIKERLARIAGVKVIKVLGGRGMEAGTPDLVGAAFGRAIALEVKRDSAHKATDLQRYRLKQWAEAGAETAVVCSVDEALDVIRRIRDDNCNTKMTNEAQP